MKTTAVDQSIEIVRRRIDQLGTREPSIMRQGSDRIQDSSAPVYNPLAAYRWFDILIAERPQSPRKNE